MASVSKRRWTHKGVVKEAWVVRYEDHAGKQRLKTFDLKKDADGWRLKTEKEVDDGTHVPESTSVTVSEAADLWIEDCVVRYKLRDRMTNATLKNYQRFVSLHLRPKFGRIKLIALDRDRCQLFVNDLALRYKLHQETAAIVLRLLFKFCVRKKLLRRSPLEGDALRLPVRRQKLARVPSKDQLRALLKTLVTRKHKEKRYMAESRAAVIVLALFAGLRRGEIAGLQWGDLDFENDVIQVRRSFSEHDGLKDPKTAAGRRDVPMVALVRQALTVIGDRSGWPSRGYVFLTVGGKPIYSNIYERYFKYAMRKAGLLGAKGVPLFSLHALRHAAVSLLIEHGLSALPISKIIGHAKVSTTLDIYGHMFPEDDRTRTAMVTVSDGFAAIVSARRQADDMKRPALEYAG